MTLWRDGSDVESGAGREMAAVMVEQALMMMQALMTVGKLKEGIAS